MNEQDFMKMVGEMEEFMALAFDAGVNHMNTGDYPDKSVPTKYQHFLCQYIATDDSAIQCMADYLRDAGYLDCRDFKKEWGDRFGFLADKNDRESFESIDEVATILTESMQNLYKERKS